MAGMSTVRIVSTAIRYLKQKQHADELLELEMDQELDSNIREMEILRERLHRQYPITRDKD